MKQLMMRIGLFLLLVNYHMEEANAQSTQVKDSLSLQHQSLVKIAGWAAIGNLSKLENALNEGLDAGLTINELKESLVHLYAYCGFPRSIRGLQTLMNVLEHRKRKGMNDPQGKEASVIVASGTKYERGKSVLAQLTKMHSNSSVAGYAEFAPVIDVFLKEHLFADLFERDVLSYAHRELVTISLLAALGGVEPMLKGHLSIGLNVGWSKQQLLHWMKLIESTFGEKEAVAAKVVLEEILSSKN